MIVALLHPLKLLLRGMGENHLYGSALITTAKPGKYNTLSRKNCNIISNDLV